MPVFHTSHGDITVSNWGYQLQGLNGAALDPAALAALDFDLLVTDFSRDGTLAQAFTSQDVTALKDGKAAAAYISIGEASDFRSFWDAGWTSNGTASGTLATSAPSWLGPTNPDWPESRKVRFWDAGWQDLIFNDAKTGWLDKIVAQGFDAAYLDIVDAYHFWAVEAGAADKKPGDPGSEKDAAQRMIDFITAMTAHARLTNPDFFVILQNGAYIIDALDGTDPVRKAALLDAAGAIAVEDVYLRNGAADENNGFLPDEAAISILQRDFAANGKAVFSVDYVNQIDKMGAYLVAALGDTFLPTVATTRGLDRTLAPLRAPADATDTADLITGSAAADTIDARGGNDTVFGFGGSDSLLGGAGRDVLSGGNGNDKLWGGTGADVLSGGAGFDWARYDDATAGLVVSLTAPGTNTGIAKGDTYSGIEGVAGGPGNDTITGNALANQLSGSVGRDRLIGLAGNDSYFADSAGDIVREQAGGGTDTVYASASFVMPLNVERLVLTGSDALNATGRGSADIITGNAGANIIIGAGGHDVLAGGAGRDTFLFRTASESAAAASLRDIITDFVHAADMINLAAIDANGARAGNAAFAFIGTHAFSGVAGQLHVRYENAAGTAHDKTIIEADINGDRAADFAIALTHLVALRATDFVL